MTGMCRVHERLHVALCFVLLGTLQANGLLESMLEKVDGLEKRVSSQQAGLHAAASATFAALLKQQLQLEEIQQDAIIISENPLLSALEDMLERFMGALKELSKVGSECKVRAMPCCHCMYARPH